MADERENSENSTEKSGFSPLTALFVLLLSLARVAHGFFWAVPGPTLPSLELNVRQWSAKRTVRRSYRSVNHGSREDNVSLLFSYRSIGVFVGSCLSGYFFPKLGGGKWKLFSLGVILCVDAFGLAVMPILKGLAPKITTIQQFIRYVGVGNHNYDHWWHLGMA